MFCYYKTLYTKLVLYFVLFFIYSYFLSFNYTMGDQEHYRLLYERLGDSKLDEILSISFSTVGSFEPITVFLIWVGAQLEINKDVYMSFWNAVLLLGLVVLARKYRMNLVFIILLSTNFYLIVLMTGAERLKFAMILLTYSFIYFDSSKARYGFIFLSPLAHFQSLIFISGYVSHVISNQILLFFVLLKIKKIALIFLVFFLVFASIFFAFFGGLLFSKFYAYFDSRSLYSFLNILLLCVVVLFVGKNKFSFFLMFSVVAVFVLLVGEERVNMIAFFLSLFFLMLEGRADHPLFLLIMLYFSIKSIPFVNNIILYGNGFYGV